MYSANGVLVKYNSPANIKVKERFLKYELLAHINETMEFLLAMAEFDDDPPLSWSHDLDRPEKLCCPSCGEEINDILTTPTDLSGEILYDEEAPDGERFMCPICYEGYATEDEARHCHNFKELYICDHCHQFIKEEDVDRIDEFDDPTDWYIVSPGFGKKLATYGELVLKSKDDLYIWGYAKKDTPMAEERVISDICYELEMLEGQEKYREVKN